MSGNSFTGFKDWEDMPLEDWALMLKIHNRAVSRHNREIEAARKRR